MRLIKLLVVLAAMLGLAGCVSQGYKPNPAYASQIIVKFKPQVTKADDRVFLDRLSRDIGAPLTYLRPLAGFAHVMKLGHDTDAEFKKALDRLNSHPDVEYAEPDRIMRIAE